ncbi:hypothetical protein GCM10007036_43810 [Alsobacter metallidurans]|uniref:Uncharacterized protein n=1 Tax=Alsobacter metallidurans TaxID=340221 RepID=A0A917IAY6_9HYPH|nr:hypothetical protein [Alsobacter metallidurans]GGH32146.1 hypothetical protein GCM10007036_43810 [Alsobacter metallidurans]
MGEAAAIAGAPNGVVTSAPPRPAPNDTAILDSLSRVLLADAKQTSDMPRGLLAESKRLQAVTRVVNAYHSYLATVAGRQMDEMTTGDIARLGMILKIIEEIEVNDRGRRLSNG